MDVNLPLALLGGMSPAAFMRRHWQKKPLLVRQAWPDVLPPLPRAALFDLAGQDGVESRVITRRAGTWTLRHGPFGRRSLPPLKTPDWTLLVQGLDLHVDAAHEMLSRFRFVPEARLDDVMVSFATRGGGVGPHLDSYDVFLLQVQGRRRWRVGRVADPSLVEGLPVKLLRNFEPTDEWVLEAGDMLYVPPLWGHDGIAEDECMTCSIGFRSSDETSLATELLRQLASDLDRVDAQGAGRRYRDPQQGATSEPGRIPLPLQDFAEGALRRALSDSKGLAQALGAILTEPKSSTWFEGGAGMRADADLVVLDRRTRMMYDDWHVFINGEAFRAAGADFRAMRRLADDRRITATALARLSDDAWHLLDEWARAGWLHARRVQPIHPEGDRS